MRRLDPLPFGRGCGPVELCRPGPLGQAVLRGRRPGRANWLLCGCPLGRLCSRSGQRATPGAAAHPAPGPGRSERVRWAEGRPLLGFLGSHFGAEQWGSACLSPPGTRGAGRSGRRFEASLPGECRVRVRGHQRPSGWYSLFCSIQGTRFDGGLQFTKHFHSGSNSARPVSFAFQGRSLVLRVLVPVCLRVSTTARPRPRGPRRPHAPSGVCRLPGPSPRRRWRVLLHRQSRL